MAFEEQDRDSPACDVQERVMLFLLWAMSVSPLAMHTAILGIGLLSLLQTGSWPIYGTPMPPGETVLVPLSLIAFACWCPPLAITVMGILAALLKDRVADRLRWPPFVIYLLNLLLDFVVVPRIPVMRQLVDWVFD